MKSWKGHQASKPAILLVLAAFLFSAPFLRAQDAKSASKLPDTTVVNFTPLPPWAIERRWTFGFQLTYGLENNIPRNISHVNMLIAAPQAGLVVWDSPHTRLPMNRFEILSEGVLGSAFHPGGSLFGDTLMFRFGFKSIRRAVPFFDAGIAAVHTTLDNHAPEISGHTQFLSQGGIGVQLFRRPGRAVVLEYRYFHMSNAGLQEPNHGFNGSMVSVGYRWLMRRH